MCVCVCVCVRARVRVKGGGGGGEGWQVGHVLAKVIEGGGGELYGMIFWTGVEACSKQS